MEPETKKEFRRREAAWLAAIEGAPSNQRARVEAWIAAERKAWGYKT